MLKIRYMNKIQLIVINILLIALCFSSCSKKQKDELNDSSSSSDYTYSEIADIVYSGVTHSGNSETVGLKISDKESNDITTSADVEESDTTSSEHENVIS